MSRGRGAAWAATWTWLCAAPSGCSTRGPARRAHAAAWDRALLLGGGPACDSTCFHRGGQMVSM